MRVDLAVGVARAPARAAVAEADQVEVGLVVGDDVDAGRIAEDPMPGREPLADVEVVEDVVGQDPAVGVLPARDVDVGDPLGVGRDGLPDREPRHRRGSEHRRGGRASPAALSGAGGRWERGSRCRGEPRRRRRPCRSRCRCSRRRPRRPRPRPRRRPSGPAHRSAGRRSPGRRARRHGPCARTGDAGDPWRVSFCSSSRRRLAIVALRFTDMHASGDGHRRRPTGDADGCFQDCCRRPPRPRPSAETRGRY